MRSANASRVPCRGHSLPTVLCAAAEWAGTVQQEEERVGSPEPLCLWLRAPEVAAGGRQSAGIPAVFVIEIQKRNGARVF